MKKGLILSGMCLMLLTGCGTKKMVCTQEDESDEVSFNAEIIVEYDKKEETVKKYTQKVTMKLLDEDYEDEFEEVADNAKDQLEDLKDELDKSFYSGKVSTSKKKISTNEVWKFDKMDEDDFEDSGLSYYYDEDDEVVYKDDVKDYLKDSGYKCKTK